MISLLCRLMDRMELETFKKIILPLRERLLLISLRLIEDQEDAEDIVQEIFLKLWLMRNQLDTYRSIEALAVTMTRNLTLDKIKLRKPVANETELLRQDTEERSPAEELEQKDAAGCIRRLIENLPTLQQTIIRMKDIEGYELSEIAEITGTQIESVRSNLSRARKRVREEYLLMMNYKLTINSGQER